MHFKVQVIQTHGSTLYSCSIILAWNQNTRSTYDRLQIFSIPLLLGFWPDMLLSCKHKHLSWCSRKNFDLLNVDVCWKIKPNNNICWTMQFGRLLYLNFCSPLLLWWDAFCAYCWRCYVAAMEWGRAYCRRHYCCYKKTTSKIPSSFFWLNACFPICLDS